MKNVTVKNGKTLTVTKSEIREVFAGTYWLRRFWSIVIMLSGII